MGLISAGVEAQIRAAIKSVTDTFMVTPVMYHMAGESLDLYNEDRKDQAFTNYTLPCLVEYSTDLSAHIIQMLEGNLDKADVVLSMNMDDMEALSLASAPNWTVPFNDTKDYFTCKGEYYKVTFVGYDGPLSTKQCLVIIAGQKAEHKT